MSNDTGSGAITSSVRADFEDTPSLGELIEALTRMRDSGAPNDAELLLSLGDKGTQRDPWTYLRGLTARWSA